ncbi:MAG TPA: hypothetical protein VFN77_03150 [Acetobacteraceae bacterium]|nr:hypothetical protein [Acetobacteraceae bacterium]
MSNAAPPPGHDARHHAANRLVIQVLRYFCERSLLPLPPLIAVADRDADDDERRKLEERLANGSARIVAPGVHAIKLLAQPWDVAPHLIAWAMCRQYGWRLAIPMDLARFLLGQGARPLAVSAILYDQPVPRRFDDFGLAFDPHAGPVPLFDLTPCGQALALGIPRDISETGLRKIGEFAGQSWFAESPFREWLQNDLGTGHLGERERIVAEALLASPRAGIPHRAPPEFEPAAHADAPHVDQWWIEERREVSFLRALLIRGHPHIPNGPVKLQTTALVWIDERLGWARTRSRVYRLGKKKPTDYP